MKKYLSLLGFLAVAGLMFSFTFSVNAESEFKETPTKIRPNYDIKENKGARFFNPEQKGEMMEDRQEFREKMQTERQAFMDKMKTDRASFMEELKAKKEAWKLSNKEDKAKFRGNAQKMIGERFNLAIENLGKIQTRVADAIADLKEDGENTDEAEDALDASKEKLADAKEKLESIKALIPDTDEKVTPEVFEQIKLLAREAKDLLKESRENLVLAIKEVKDLKDTDSEDEDEDKDD